MSTEPFHQREYFDMYGILLDLGGWSYVVEDTGIVYVNEWFPYSRPVRLAPDVASYSWRNEYVAVYHGLEPHPAVARLRLAIRRQGSGAMVVDVFPRARIARVARQLAAATRPASPPRRPDSAW